MSKSHPGRLDFRSVLLVLASPFLFVFGISEAIKGEDPMNGYLAIGAAILFMLFGGVHLYGRYGGRDR